LLFDQELGIADQIDEQDVPDLKSKIFLGFRRHGRWIGHARCRTSPPANARSAYESVIKTAALNELILRAGDLRRIIAVPHRSCLTKQGTAADQLAFQTRGDGTTNLIARRHWSVRPCTGDRRIASTVLLTPVKPRIGPLSWHEGKVACFIREPLLQISRKPRKPNHPTDS